MRVTCSACGHVWNYKPRKPSWKRASSKVICPKCKKMAFRLKLRRLARDPPSFPEFMETGLDQYEDSEG